jgi:hypothetical protein
LVYTVTIAKVPFLYDYCKDIMFEEYRKRLSFGSNTQSDMVYEAIDAAPWGAIEAYQPVLRGTGTRTRYLLCYGDRIVEITFDWELSKEQMVIVAEKLNNT